MPWWSLLVQGAAWSPVVFVIGTALFAPAFATMPLLMVLNHGRRHLDWAAVAGDTLVGVAWVLFV